MPRVFVIDGRDLSTLEEFYEVIGAVLVPGEDWGKNLAAFNDILCWPLNEDPEPYVLVWMHSKVSRKRLNDLEAERQLEKHLQYCHVSGRPDVAEKLARARRCEGPTVFDWLLEIILEHPDWLTFKLE